MSANSYLTGAKPTFAKSTRTISVTSGKGGVGKTTLVANLAGVLAAKGERILLLDGDLGMANLDIVFGKKSKFTLEAVIKDQCPIEDVLMEVSPGVDLIPGGTGVYGLHRLDSFQRSFLIDEVTRIGRDYSIMLIDTAPGIDDHVLVLNSAAQETIVVITPDPTSLADAYALMKILNLRHKESRFSIVCNLVRDEAEGLRIFKGLSDVATQYLCISLTYKGSIPMDLNLRKSVRSQQLCVKQDPKTPASYAIQKLAEKLTGSTPVLEAKGGIQFFWQQLVGLA